MDPDLLELGFALALGAALYVAVAAYVWSHRESVGGRALALLLLAAGIWTICGAVEVSLPGPPAQELWGGLKYVGIVLLPPALLSFAVEYTGRRRRMGPRTVLLLAIEPVVVLGALAVPPWRHLVRSLPADARYGQFALVRTGPLFWVHLVYSYAVIVAAVALLVVALLRVSRRYSRAWLLIATCVLPLALNAAYNFGGGRWLSSDPTPLGFSLVGLVLVWGFFRFRLSELIPLGRGQVMDRIPDAVLVLDHQGHVVDANPAADDLVGGGRADLVGRDLLDLMPQLAAVIGDGPPDVPSSGHSRAKRRDGAAVDLAVTVSPLPGGDRPATGRLVVLRDVTAQREVERRLRDLVTERTATIETLRRGLSPGRLPEIPGVAIAAVLDPAEAETSISGDFVDVRPSGVRRWSLVVGDVVGKGAGAATLTALARHTTVALTALGWAPAAVLAEVSRAIAADEAAAGDGLDTRFCTMALATVGPADDQDAIDVVLALGGHPRPMLVTARGEVTEVGIPGSLLGILPDPDLHDVRLRLTPGETLVLFTDGVTEARRGPEAFGEERLATLLASLAGTPAGHVVHEVVAAVRAFSGPDDGRDDVAVVALGVPRP